MAVEVRGDNSLQWKASIDLSSLKDQVGEINKTLGRVGSQIKGQSEEIDRFSRNAANAIKTYISVTAISGFVQSIVKVRGEFQQLEVAFQTILASKEKADQLMAQVVDLAAKTPFGLEDAAKGAKQLLAYGFAADKVKETLVTLGNVASGVGAPLNDIVYLYGTLRTQGRAFQKDIIQFTGRGIPIIAELAKQFGVAEDQVQKLVQAGKVGFPEIEKAFQSLTSEGGIFNNLMEKQSQTISGLISNFGDAWETMLNDIGKSQEGPIANIIKGSISVVENYQKVLDVLKVLVISYGAYRAAVIATAAVQTIAANATKGWTIAQTLHYKAMILSERAMKLLNAAMLTNPYVAVTTAVVGLIAVLKVFNKQTDSVRSKQQLLNEYSEKLNDNLTEQKAKIAPLVEALKQGNLTEQERLGIYNKLNAISPKLVQGLDAQSLSYNGLIKNVNDYIASIKDQMNMEANASAIRDSMTNENKLQKQYEAQKAYVERLEKLQKTTGFNATTAGNALVGNVNLDSEKKKLAQIEDAQKRQKQVTEQLAKDSVDQQKKTDEIQIRQNKEYWENILKEAQDGYDALTQLEIKQGKGKVFVDRINQAKEQLKIYDLTGKSLKVAQREEDKYNSMLEKRAKVMVDISDIERKSSQTGLLQRQKDIDSINERYDKQLDVIKDINAEIEKHNQQYPNKKISLFGDAEQARIEAARQVELNNFSYREDAENYMRSVEEKKNAFEQLRQAQESGSTEIIEATRNQYREQVGEFDSYISYLKSQIAPLINDILSGNATLDQKLKFEGLTKLIEDAGKEGAERFRQSQIDSLNSLIELAQTYNSKRIAIDKKYKDLFATLEKQKTAISEKEYKDRMDALNELRRAELNDTDIDLINKSKAYKEFQDGFQDIGIKATKSIIDGLQRLKEKFRENADAVKLLDAAIKSSEEAISKKTVSAFRELAGIISSIGSNLNIELSQTLKITGQQIAQIVNNVGTLFDKNASKTSQVGSIIGIVTSVFTTIRDALLTEEDMREPLQDQRDIYEAIAGQIEAANYGLERQLDIINDLNGVQKLNAQQTYLTDLKEQQDKALKSLKEFKLEYIKSSKEIFVDPLFGTETENKGVWGVFTNLWTAGTVKKKIKYELSVVDTSSFETIEDFKDLLQEIKEGGGKINGKQVVEDDLRGLELFIQTYDEAVAKQKELKDQLDQIFTGTTASSIADSIIEGFKAGKRTIEDFADDFEDLMRAAILNSLKYQTLEAPLADFYEEFSKKSASDGILTSDEISQLKGLYEDIITKAGQQFENLKEITKIDISGGDKERGLAGAIKGMTEQQADLLAGQFGGLRMTAIEQLRVATSSLEVMNQIQANTARLIPIYDLWRRIELNGLKVV